MQVSLEIPDEVAGRMARDGGDVPRLALEAILAEEYRLGRIHKPDLRRLLGFESSGQIDAFLNAHKVYDEYTIEELNREVAMLERMGV